MSVSRGASVLLRPASPGAGPAPVRVVTAVRHAGESLYGGALRALREAGLDGLEPWALDLSAKQALFVADVPDTVDVRHVKPDTRDEVVARMAGLPYAALSFRPLTRADLRDVVRWTREPHVAQWWNDGAVTPEAAEQHYGPAIAGTDPIRVWVVEVNGRSVGFVQDYLIADHPDYALLTAHPDAVGLDYVLGVPSLVNRGLGTRMLWQLLRDVVRPHYPGSPLYFAAPDHRNAASLRVLDKLGFKQGLWFDEPQPDGTVDTVVGCALKVKRVFGAAPRLAAEA